MGLIVDTSEIIHTERQGRSPTDIIRRYGIFETYGISAITVAELQHGVRRADTSVRRSTRTQFLDEVLLVFPTYPLTAPIAQRLGDLDADLQLAGQRRDLPDLIIAATALELDFAVATRNRKHFENIPGLRLAEPK